MRYVKPQYYDSFRCAADRCPDTCCAGWQIMIDDASLQRYMNTAGPVGDRLLEGVDWQEGCFKQKKDRCAFLNEKNLCELVLKEGEEALCETCSRYPRHTEEFAGLRELSLSLSCPEAARIILLQKELPAFLVQQDDERDPLWEEFEEFDFLLFTQLEDARTVLFQILQNRELALEKRMELILEMAEKMQDCVDEGSFFELEQVTACFAKKAKSETIQQQPQISRRYKRLKEGFFIFYRLEHLREDWTELLMEAEKTLYLRSQEEYKQLRMEFLSLFGQGGPKQGWREMFLGNLLWFFLYTYFCGAVYDDWIYSKAALSVFAVCYVEELMMNAWYQAGKSFDEEAYVRIAWCFAREIEHSDENLNLLEKWLQQSRETGGECKR